MLALADERLSQGETVILDGSFLNAGLRTRALLLGRRREASVAFLECRCPKAISAERIESRLARGDSPSEATADLLDEQAEQNDADPDQFAFVEGLRFLGFQIHDALAIDV